MKKIIFCALFIVTAVSASAQATSTICVDLSVNLVRGAESNNVLKLQNFLFAKGLLKATPNGYFGPGTLAAVKAYQKSVGLSQVGNTGPMTRAAIKKDSCGTSIVSQAPAPAATPAPVPVIATTTPVISVPAQVAPVSQPIPKPVFESIDYITLFSGGQTDWTFNLHGTNFSTSSNTVKFKNVSSRVIYDIGSLVSATGTTITIPTNVTNTAFSCGINCNEKMPPGLYEITITRDGLESNAKTLDIKSFVTTVQTATLQTALPAATSKVLLGTLTFSPSTSVLITSITLNVEPGSTTGGLYNTALIDASTGSLVDTSGNAMPLYSFQSKIITAYVGTNNTNPGNIKASFTIIVEDYIGKKQTKFVSPSFLVTIDGVL